MLHVSDGGGQGTESCHLAGHVLLLECVPFSPQGPVASQLAGCINSESTAQPACACLLSVWPLGPVAGQGP
jgi:hypothetical protein